MVLVSAIKRPSWVDQISPLLLEIEQRTAEIRGGEALVLVPFAPNEEDLRHLAGGDPAPDVEAGSWSECGIVFGSPRPDQRFSRPAFEQATLFRLEMDAVLLHCHVVAIVSETEHDLKNIDSILHPLNNSWAFIAAVSAESAATRYFETSPLLRELSATDWLLLVKKRWQTVRPDLQDLPPMKRTFLGYTFPWLVAAAIRRRFENVRKRPRSQSDLCREGMGVSESALEKLSVEDRKLLNEDLASLCPFFVRHDGLGRHYSNVFRTACLLVPVLIAIATILAVAAIIQPSNHDLWHIVEGAVLVVAAWLVARTRVQGHHAKWVENRPSLLTRSGFSRNFRAWSGGTLWGEGDCGGGDIG